VQLLGEDGRSLYSNSFNFKMYYGRSITMAADVPFNITAAAETGRLVVSVQDKAGRRIALASVDLILQLTGENYTTASSPDYQPYLVRFPLPGEVISGGTLHISGLARPVNNTPLVIELIDEGGQVVGSTQVQVASPTGNLSHTPFFVDVPYRVTGSTPVRLTIRQESNNRVPGTVALNSELILLEP
jgi:hypothetical protein